MLAKNEKKALSDTFSVFEFLAFHLSALFFSCTIVLMPSFIDVFTRGVTDIDYQRPLFLYFFVAAEFIYCIRIPFYALMSAAGHYKQTKKSAILEAVINLAVSLILIWRFGLVGVAIGSLVAIAFRTVELIIYDSKYLIKMEWKKFFTYVATSTTVFVSVIFASKFMPSFQNLTYLSWLINALIVFFISFLFSFLISIVFCKNEIYAIYAKIFGAFRRNQ
jgi:O-antigen/teichoic acid export membrane protein